MKRLLKTGDRIRLNVRTLGGWKGLATVTRNQSTADDAVFFRCDGDEDNDLANSCVACRHEVSKLRKQQ